MDHANHLYKQTRDTLRNTPEGHADYAKAEAAFVKARDRLDAARLAYDTTPAGQQDLHRKIAGAARRGDAEQAKRLTMRQIEGELTRQAQQDAYRAHLDATGAPDVDTVPAELREFAGQAAPRRETSPQNRQGITGPIRYEPHLRDQAAAKGFAMTRIEAVLRQPERVTDVRRYPGQKRYCGDGIAVVADGNRIVTCYLDGVVTPLRKDQLDDPAALASSRLRRGRPQPPAAGIVARPATPDAASAQKSAPPSAAPAPRPASPYPPPSLPSAGTLARTSSRSPAPHCPVR